MTIFAERLDMLMAEWRLNRSQVASRVGVAPSTVHRWFTRDSVPNLDVIGRIADYFGVNERWLRGAIDERTPVDVLVTKQEEEKNTDESDIDDELVRIIKSLNPQQVQRLKDFLAGLRG